MTQVILLDIEGTTTPVDYVFGVLFPYAKTHVADFLTTQSDRAQSDLDRLQQEYNTDIAEGIEVPEWSGSEAIDAVPYIQFLIERDRKSTGLKSLQGKIWDQGYCDGSLKSQIFPDVQPALVRWTDAGKQIHIFSSGSVQAQKLLFQYTEQGDLTPYLSGYFDTETGPKREPRSYQAIAAAIGVPPTDILFVSDVVAELVAARSAQMRTCFSQRPGNPATDPEGFNCITTFDQVDAYF